MKCPKCGWFGYSKGGNIEQDGIILRRRVCDNGHWFWTHETVLLDKGPNPALTMDDTLTLLRNERG